MLGDFQSPLISLLFLETEGNWQVPTTGARPPRVTVWGCGRALARYTPHPGPFPLSCSQPTPASPTGLHPTPLAHFPAASCPSVL